VSSPITHEQAGQFAAELYLKRKSRAVAAVRSGKVAPQQADRALYPWLAIACLCGADLPDLRPLIAAERNPQWLHGTPVPISDAQARESVADAICPASKWAITFAKARDEAYAAACGQAADQSAARVFKAVADHLAAMGYREIITWPSASMIPPANAFALAAAA